MITQVKKILIAPLDWGLGHTSRCVPLIRYLQQQGHSVTFAGNEWQRSFIKETFGAIDNIHLEGYHITYSRKATGNMLHLISQIPRIKKTIKLEHEWLAGIVESLKPDAIISDNRYGLYHQHTPSVIITHQLRVRSGIGDWTDGILQHIHYQYINKFQRIWVPDTPGMPYLSGTLGHPQNMPKHVHYVGLLSQFEEISPDSQPSDYLLALLSGPEPQRTILSQMLWQQFRDYSGKVVFVEGTRDAPEPAFIPPHITYHKRLSGSQLSEIIQKAGWVICRSGYSTIMDLVKLNKKAILIPTPGQTEQAYLGRFLHEQGVFYCAKQNDFDLNKTMIAMKDFPFHSLTANAQFDTYKQVLDEWLATIR